MDTKTLLARVREEATPLIDGQDVTFVWRGMGEPLLIGDWTNWEWGEPVSLRQIAPRVWVHTMTAPRDAYLEYAYMRGRSRVPDPFNAHTTPNGFGASNHFFYMPAASPTPLLRREHTLPRGVVKRERLPTQGMILGKWRDVYLYQPAVDEPVPLLVVLDGVEYMRRGKLTCILDNLIAQQRIRPLALALIQNGGRARMLEYACAESTMAFILSTALPFARAHLNLSDVQAFPGAFGILGASMGGLMALYAGLRAPEVFGHVLSQSGAFTLGEYDTVLYDLIRANVARSLRVWMDVGTFEWLLTVNRKMHLALREQGYDVTYREYDAGHNYPAWRNDVSRGLETLFGQKGCGSALG